MSEQAERRLVLVADDDVEIRRIVKRAIAGLDCDVVEASDGEEALELLITEQPDVIVLDVMMPSLSGWEICQYVRSKPEYEHVAVLMLTAVGKAVNEMTAPLYGADDYLDKPFDLKELVARVQRLLEGRPVAAE